MNYSFGSGGILSYQPCRGTTMPFHCNSSLDLIFILHSLEPLVLSVSEEMVAQDTGLPQTSDWWFKNFKISHQSYDYVFKPKFLTMNGDEGFSRVWIREEFINPLVVINKIITCEGRFSTFKTCHFRLLSLFEFIGLINFPFYFWKILGKMDSKNKKLWKTLCLEGSNPFFFQEEKISPWYSSLRIKGPW